MSSTGIPGVQQCEQMSVLNEVFQYLPRCGIDVKGDSRLDLLALHDGGS
jgi:hypothetical protein